MSTKVPGRRPDAATRAATCSTRAASGSEQTRTLGILGGRARGAAEQVDASGVEVEPGDLVPRGDSLRAIGRPIVPSPTTASFTIPS